MELAALLLADGDADQVLVIAAEPAEQAEDANEAEQAAAEGGFATAVLVTA